MSDKISNDVEDGQREEKEGVEKKLKEFIEMKFFYLTIGNII